MFRGIKMKRKIVFIIFLSLGFCLLSFLLPTMISYVVTYHNGISSFIHPFGKAVAILVITTFLWTLNMFYLIFKIISLIKLKKANKNNATKTM